MRIVELLIKVLPDHEPLEVPCYPPFSGFEPADLYSDYLEQEAAQGKGVAPHSLKNTDLQLAQGGVGWVIWREMALYRFSSARLMSHISEFDALARKDTLWPCISHAISFETSGRE
ncbi:hypothetical protein TNCV_4467391 [Trichonephila clavipes]|nr:hypothetical protein TNCV_4467391 [Trichonephila clavipes]